MAKNTKNKRIQRNWHKDFIKYMKFIVKHKNYASMPNKYKDNGEINWVSPKDRVRAKWWDKKKKKLGFKDRASVARKIHPKVLKGLKPCQICGRKMSIFYVYPNKNTLKKLNRINSSIQFKHFEENIEEVYKLLREKLGKEIFNQLRNIFSIPDSIKKTKKEYLHFIKLQRKTRLSPGVMSNAPDRLDGFHTYNACCRSKEDTGRHRSNLARYTQDRRAYENWAEGNWNLSNRLMGEFNRFSKKRKCQICGKRRKLTPDHIGPISLGYTHRPHFNALCSSCNSRKNNRMSLEDVETLKRSEKRGKKVISWHSKYLWDLLKNEVSNKRYAIRLSKLLRKNLHNILTILAIIKEKGHSQFLKRFLNPQYSFYDYQFINFDPIKGPEKIIEKPLDSKNKRKNANRYLRIAFESLDEYKSVKNRKTKVFKNKKVNKMLNKLFEILKNKENKKAEDYLKKILAYIAKKIAKDF